MLHKKRQDYAYTINYLIYKGARKHCDNTIEALGLVSFFHLLGYSFLYTLLDVAEPSFLLRTAGITGLALLYVWLTQGLAYLSVEIALAAKNVIVAEHENREQ